MALCLVISLAGEFHCFTDTFAVVLKDDDQSKLE